MPLDKRRITGFGGADMATAAGRSRFCREGHELQRWSARAGTCDGCGCKVGGGDTVMDCRRCDYYLCAACLPPDAAQGSSIWGTVSSLPFYWIDAASHGMSDVAAEIEPFVLAWDGDGDASRGNSRSRRGSIPLELWTEAEQLLAEFCADHSRESWPHPSEAELETVWSRCCVLYGCVLKPGPISKALWHQLTPLADAQDEDLAWRRQLRALCVFEHFRQKGEVGQEVTHAVSTRGRPLLQRLAEAPQAELAAKARQILEALPPTSPSAPTTQRQAPSCSSAAGARAPPAKAPGGRTNAVVASRAGSLAPELKEAVGDRALEPPRRAGAARRGGA